MRNVNPDPRGAPVWELNGSSAYQRGAELAVIGHHFGSSAPEIAVQFTYRPYGMGGPKKTDDGSWVWVDDKLKYHVPLLSVVDVDGGKALTVAGIPPSGTTANARRTVLGIGWDRNTGRGIPVLLPGHEDSNHPTNGPGGSRGSSHGTYMGFACSFRYGAANGGYGAHFNRLNAAPGPNATADGTISGGYYSRGNAVYSLDVDGDGIEEVIATYKGGHRIFNVGRTSPGVMMDLYLDMSGPYATANGLPPGFDSKRMRGLVKAVTLETRGRRIIYMVGMPPEFADANGTVSGGVGVVAVSASGYTHLWSRYLSYSTPVYRNGTLLRPGDMMRAIHIPGDGVVTLPVANGPPGVTRGSYMIYNAFADAQAGTNRCGAYMGNIPELYGCMSRVLRKATGNWRFVLRDLDDGYVTNAIYNAYVWGYHNRLDLTDQSLFVTEDTHGDRSRDTAIKRPFDFAGTIKSFVTGTEPAWSHQDDPPLNPLRLRRLMKDHKSPLSIPWPFVAELPPATRPVLRARSDSDNTTVSTVFVSDLVTKPNPRVPGTVLIKAIESIRSDKALTGAVRRFAALHAGDYLRLLDVTPIRPVTGPLKLPGRNGDVRFVDALVPEGSSEILVDEAWLARESLPGVEDLLAHEFGHLVTGENGRRYGDYTSFEGVEVQEILNLLGPASAIAHEDSFSVLSAYRRQVLADRPVAFYPVDEAPGVTWLWDASDNGNHADIGGVVRLGQASPFTSHGSGLSFSNGEKGAGPFHSPGRSFGRGRDHR